MIPLRRARLVAVMASIVALGLALTGCSVLQNLDGHLSGQIVTPTVGDCWRVSYAASQKSEDWEGAGPVSCAATHETYTYAVGTITQKFTGSWLGANGTPRADVDNAALAVCRVQQARVLPALTANEALLAPTYYVPSVAQWNAGARWVRCDLTEIEVGSSFDSPELAPLPTKFATLVAALAANPKKFALCEDDPANNGPDGDQTTYASCTGPSDWSRVFTKYLLGASGAAYPGTPALKALGNTECVVVYSTNNHVALAVYPTEGTWTKYGDREFDCWVNNN